MEGQMIPDNQGYSTPKPDPTILTTEQLMREIGGLDETTKLHIEGVEARLQGEINLTGERFEALRRALDERYATQQFAIQIAATSAHGAKELFNARLEAMREMLNERYQTQCVSADTPVLCTDLIWRPAGDLLVGDELIGFDEEPALNHEGGHRSVRRFRRSVVTANTLKRDFLLRVTTTHGSIRCNRDHPFLARHDKRGWQWVRAEDLTPGIMLMSVCDVWEYDPSREAGWLAGFIDGEGCLSVGGKSNDGRARFTINQCVGPTADRMVDILKERFPYIKMTEKDLTKYAKPGHVWRPLVQMQMDRRIDIMRLLGSIRPERLLINSAKVWENFPLRGTERRATVTSVDAVGTGLIASLSTSTETYIANGFAVHNTKALDAAFVAQQAAVATSFDASEKAMAAALLAAKEAVEKANVANDKRFDAVNEFRAQLADIQTTLLPRNEADAKFSALDARVADMKSTVDKGFTGVDVRHGTATEDRLESRADLRSYLALFVALAAIAVTLFLAMHH